MKKFSFIILILLVLILAFWRPSQNPTQSGESEFQLEPEHLIFAGSSPDVFLINRNHEIVKRWSHPKYKFQIAKIYGNQMAAISQRLGIFLYDLHGGLRKKLFGRYHHDFAFIDENTLLTLEQRQGTVKIKGRDLLVLDDYIVKLNINSGRVLAEASISNLLGSELDEMVLNKAYRDANSKVAYLDNGKSGDIIHANSIEIIDRDIGELFAKGDLLLSSRTQNKIFVVDAEMNQVKWTCCEDMFSWQHHPSIAKDDTVLLFDNGKGIGQSRIIKIDPLTKKIVWEYKPGIDFEYHKVIKRIPYYQKKKFFSQRGSGVYQLENGNFLITAEQMPLVFEISPDKEITWVFTKDQMPLEVKDQKRPILYRLVPVYGYDSLQD